MTENPQKPKEIDLNSLQQHVKQHSHQHQHDLDDGCQNCVKQKQQNQKLVDFYQRLNQITGKVASVKNNYSNQKKQLQASQTPSIKKKQQSPEKALDNKINAINQVNLKEMGFQLAAALIERQMKIKQQNERLQSIIDKLTSQKAAYSINSLENQTKDYSNKFFSQNSFNEGSNTQFNSKSAYDDKLTDSLDFLDKQTPQTRYKKSHNDKRSNENDYWNVGIPVQYNNSSTHRDNKVNSSYQQSTFFSTIDNKRPNRSEQNKVSGVKQKKSFQGMNLWLYKVQTQKYDANSKYSVSDFLGNSQQSINETKFTQKKKSNYQKYGSPKNNKQIQIKAKISKVKK